MQISTEEHLARPWRIHELVPDFQLEDVWTLPTPGGPDEFHTLVEGFARADPSEIPSRPARWLWDLRFKIGDVLGWDDPGAKPVGPAASLRDRLPEDLRGGPSGPEFQLPAEPLYLLENEFAGEIVNKTMHGVMHLSWVADADTRSGADEATAYHGVLAVYVRPNGLLGDAYMAAIRPFRHYIVYPPMMRQVARTWERRAELPDAA